jgi:hypothetical protein
MIMDESTLPNRRDAAIGEILILQGAYFSAPFPRTPAEFTDSNIPRPLRFKASHEEAVARQKLRVRCPVMATIKELGLCDETTYALLLMRSSQLILSQHHSKEFNLCRRVMDEGIADKQRDQVLGELLVMHGGYFSHMGATFHMQKAIYCRWKDEDKCECCTVPSIDMQMQLLLHPKRGWCTTPCKCRRAALTAFILA